MSQKNFVLGLALVSSFVGMSTSSIHAEVSSLWGSAGEKWNPDGRLPDFSYAGYQNGEKIFPTQFSQTFNVKDFGEKGDGSSDDLEAIKKTIEKASSECAAPPANPCAVLLPEGEYK